MSSGPGSASGRLSVAALVLVALVAGYGVLMPSPGESPALAAGYDPMAKPA